MANSFGSLYIGQSGLTSAQNALNTTANNISNVDTEGYVREQVRFADKNYSTIKIAQPTTNLQQYGLGATIGDVVHARDVFLDKAFRQENGREAFYSTCYETTTQVEDLLQELDGEEFADSITDLYQAIEEMAKDPADSTNENLLLQKCQLFLSRSASLYSDLKSYQSNLNTQIKDIIDSINEKGDRIYELNLEIQKIESGNTETAMTLRDERDQLIDELSAYVKIDASEDATGFTHINVEGSEFVADMCCFHIDTLYDYDTGFYTPYWPNLSNTADNADEYIPVFDMDADAKTENNTDIGSLKALMIQRGDHFGTLADMVDLDAYSGIESSSVMETQAELDSLYHSVATMINDLFCPNKELSSVADTYTFESGITGTTTISAEDIDKADSTYSLIGNKSETDSYYIFGTVNGKTLIAADTAQILDADEGYYDGNGDLFSEDIFARNSMDRYTEVSAKDADGKDVTLYVYNDENLETPYTLYHIGTTQINEKLEKQITLMGAYQKDGSVAYDLGNALSNAWSTASLTLNPTDNTPVNYEGFYNKMVSKLGTDGNVYQASEETLTATTTSLENSRQQVTGVSSDEELTNMVRFQSAYNASSRFMTVIAEMTDTIVNLI